jgi:hypothetical protein
MTMTFDFLETLNVLHKFSVFESMRRHSSISGVLTQRELQNCIEDGTGPTKLFEVAD